MKLFDVIVESEDLHSNFNRIKSDQEKVRILEEWADETIKVRDGGDKFIKEFQTTFNSAFWELYCYQVLKELKCQIDFKYNAPDFVFEFNGEPLLIECAIANNANDMPPEHNIVARFLYDNVNDVVYEQTIRLSNAFCKKYSKYKKSYGKKEWVKNKPYIIAMAPYEQPNFMMAGNEAITQLLYGWQLDRERCEQRKVIEIYKKEGVGIPLGLFCNSDYEDVSAVLFSSVATMGKVTAMGNSPDKTFGQIRYNLKYDRPSVQFDSRLQQKKYDRRCEMVKQLAKLDGDAYKDYTIRRPLIKWGVDYKEEICDGLHLYVNPFAANPISEETLNELYMKGINIIQYDIEKEEEMCRIHDGSLVHRMVF